MLHFVSAIPGITWPAIPPPRGAALLSLLAQLEASEWWPPEKLRAEQLRQLQPLLAHAYENVPFHRSRFDAIGLDPRNGVGWEEFRALPLLTRDEVRARGGELFTRRRMPHHGGLIQGHTSGSTGTPIRYLSTEAAVSFEFAAALRDHLWHRRDLGAKLAVIRTDVDDRNSAGWDGWLNEVLYSGQVAKLNIRASIDAQAAWLRRQNPSYLISFPSNLEALARHFLERGIRLPRLKQAGTLSEVVKPALRQLCRDAWGVGITDLYSANEAGTIALQCPSGDRYHVQAENLVVEVINENGAPCRPGEPGRVVITSLHNFAMPLVRYEIGDYAVPGEPCPCGRGLPVLERILGRTRNLVTLPDGSRHWPYFSVKTWAYDAPVRQMQLVQHDLQHIEVRLVTDRELTAREAERMTGELHGALGHPFRISISYVEAIGRNGNFKYEDFVSKLS